MNQLIYDCAIIGSGPAALTAGIYMARAGYKVNIITGQLLGGTLTYIQEIENYPGLPCVNGADLAFNMIQQCEQLGITFTYYKSVRYFYRIGCNKEFHPVKIGDLLYNVYALFLKQDTDTNELIKEDYLKNYENADIYAKSVIIAAGTTPNKLNLPNEEKYYSKGIHFCASCDGHFYKNKKVLIVGGGNSAFNEALYLSNICKEVIIVHRRDKFRAEQIMIDKCKNKPNIKFLMDTVLTNIIGREKVHKVEIDTKGVKTVLTIDGIFYALGTTKNNIPYDDFNNTRIFNTGDYSLEHMYHQVIIAAGDGAKTAINCIQNLK